MNLKEKLQKNVSSFKESSIDFVEKECERRSELGYTDVQFDIPFYSETIVNHFIGKGLDVKVQKHPADRDKIIGFILSW